MSTYLVAFVISDYLSIKKVSQKGILVEVAARRDAILNKDGDFALEKASKIIDYFVDYFNVSYPFKSQVSLIN